MRRRIFFVPTIILTTLLLASCAGNTDTAQNAATSEATSTSDETSEAAELQEFPDVVDAALTASGDEFTVAVTISSPYDTPQRYADGWRVLSPDGDVLAEHQLGHDHANEQPFTRTGGTFAIPENVDEVTVEGRDQDNGYGGATVTVEVPR
ncbi:hypothetical protein [Microbacterium sp. NPDC076911]|uniref:hypothetical protein n=1 Tax=Microbacterium sp. NPDC076911 TaxID=3154958 RepID=UPI003434F306